MLLNIEIFNIFGASARMKEELVSTPRDKGNTYYRDRYSSLSFAYFFIYLLLFIYEMAKRG